MTDKEIIKALEICSNPHIGCDTDCPYKKGAYACRFEMPKDALALINRLKAEIDQLCMEIDELIISKDSLFDEAEALIKKSKIEAVKEFAERLKMLNNSNLIIWNEQIDNLVKEMVGDE